MALGELVAAEQCRQEMARGVIFHALVSEPETGAEPGRRPGAEWGVVKAPCVAVALVLPAFMYLYCQ
jgi:hypothetical protein